MENKGLRILLGRNFSQRPKILQFSLSADFLITDKLSHESLSFDDKHNKKVDKNFIRFFGCVRPRNQSSLSLVVSPFAKKNVS